MRGAAWLGMSRLVLNALGLVSTLVLARLLVPADFGIVAISTAALNIVIALTELSLGSALIQRAEVTRTHIDTVWTMALIRAGAVVAIFAALAVPMGYLYHDSRLVPVLLVTGLTGALNGVISPVISMRTKALDFKPQLFCQLIQRGGAVAVSVTLAVLMQSYWAIVLGSAAGAVLLVIASYVLAPHWPRFTLAGARDLMGFSSWLFAEQVVTAMNWRFDQLLVGIMLSKRDLGAYSLAVNLSALPSREITAPLVQALFPGFSNLARSVDRLPSAYLKAQRAIALVTIPAGVGFALIASPLVMLVLGEKWAMTIPMIQVLSCSFAFQTLTIGLRPLAMAMGATRLLFFREGIGLAIRLPCVVVAAMVWGLDGLVWARTITAAIGTVIALDIVRKLIGRSVPAQLVAHGRTAAATAAMVLAALGVLRLLGPGTSTEALIAQIAAVAIVGGSVYVGVVALLWKLRGAHAGPEHDLAVAMNRAFGMVGRRIARRV